MTVAPGGARGTEAGDCSTDVADTAGRERLVVVAGGVGGGGGAMGEADWPSTIGDIPATPAVKAPPPTGGV